MPEICRFYGIIIAMFADDHNPPHFHVRYGNYQAIVTIETEVIKGEIPTSVVRYISEWMILHKDELRDNWKRLQEGKEPQKIEPLNK